jgi:Tfp pilus assembly protein PilN
MRPVNLIPPDERRGDRTAMRTGNVAYVVLGALALGLLGVIVLALTSKQISDRESEVKSLEQEEQAVQAKAQNLRAFADFRAVQVGRTATVASLAQSRFDWERVIRELSLVIPEDVWLTNLAGTVSPNVGLDAGAEVSLRDNIEGPALELVGCASGQDAVAGFITDLEDIDGVTRVGLQVSELPTEQAEEAEAGGGQQASSDTDCRTRDFITKFELVVAFDSVPTPPTATAAPSVPAPVAPSGDASQLAGAQAEGAATGGSAPGQSAEAQSAAGSAQGGE